MDDYRVVLCSLHEVRVDSILEECYNCARNAKVVDRKWGVVVAYTEHDAADTCVEVVDVAREAEDSHNLRCWSDVEACLGRDTVCRAAETRYDITQRAVVHIKHTTPHNLLQTHLL